MKITVERVDDVTVKLSVTVEAERVRDAVERAARSLAHDIKVPGFRPGRVPRKVLESRLGKGVVLQEAVREALPDFYAEAVEAEELAVVGPPDFDVEEFSEGQDAVFTATVEVRPDFDVPDYHELKVPHPDWEVTDEEVDQQLEQLRERFGELESVSRPAKAGDYVLVTITGSHHGEVVEDASGEDLLYEVGDPEETESALDRNLVGAGAGAVLKFNDTLGADYGERAGTELTFTAIVKEVKAKRLPALDDDFAITASQHDTIDELIADVREQLDRQKRAAAMATLRGRVVEAVADLVDVPVPSSLVQHEIQYRLDQLARDAQRQGMEFEDYLQAIGTSSDEVVSRLEAQARETVKAQLVVDAVGREAGVEVTRDDLGHEVARQAARLGRPVEELAEFMTHPDRIGMLVSDAFRRKTIDHLVASVQVLGGPPEADEEDGARDLAVEAAPALDDLTEEAEEADATES